MARGTGSKQHVIEKANALGYVPNTAPRGIRTNKTFHIAALLFNDPGHPLHGPASFEILQGINPSLERAGYVLELMSSPRKRCHSITMYGQWIAGNTAYGPS